MRSRFSLPRKKIADERRLFPLGLAGTFGNVHRIDAPCDLTSAMVKTPLDGADYKIEAAPGLAGAGAV